jgi:DNA primase
MFPIIDIRNRVIGFGGRALDEADVKYMNSPETCVLQEE